MCVLHRAPDRRIRMNCILANATLVYLARHVPFEGVEIYFALVFVACNLLHLVPYFGEAARYFLCSIGFFTCYVCYFCYPQIDALLKECFLKGGQ